MFSQALTVGISVTILEFPEDDGDLMLAYCAAMHDQETNKYRATSIRNLVEVGPRADAMVGEAKAALANYCVGAWF